MFWALVEAGTPKRTDSQHGKSRALQEGASNRWEGQKGLWFFGGGWGEARKTVFTKPKKKNKKFRGAEGGTKSDGDSREAKKKTRIQPF